MLHLLIKRCHIIQCWLAAALLTFFCEDYSFVRSAKYTLSKTGGLVYMWRGMPGNCAVSSLYCKFSSETNPPRLLQAPNTESPEPEEALHWETIMPY